MRLLTERAKTYLASFERVTPTPLSVVKQLFEDKGYVPDPAWLTFHENYAGYIEGRDVIWGLCYEDDGPLRRARTLNCHDWRSPKKGNELKPMSVVCADLGFDVYDLLRDGAFVGHPWKSESFAIKIEQTAIENGFHRPRTRCVREINGLSVFKQIEELQIEMAEPSSPSFGLLREILLECDTPVCRTQNRG